MFLISNFFATSRAFSLNLFKTSSFSRILIAFAAISSTFPTLLKYPETPSKLTSGSPPELLEITGTPQAIASKAAKPKLSVSDGSKNKSVKHKILSISLLFPKKITLS
ncbi:hypothetical protein D3C72_2238590 [compost metagenome]